MKKYIYYIAVVLLLSINLMIAQDDQLDDLNFEEQNYEQFEDEATPYFAIGGGPVMNMLFLNYDDINALLKNNGFSPADFNLAADKFLLDGNMFQFGAQGIVTIGLIDNVRIGIISMGGTSSPKNPAKGKVINATDTFDVTRFFDYNVNYTGITIDYAYIPFNSFKLAVVPGVTLGWGNLSIESYQTQSDFNWNDLKPVSDGVNYNTEISTSMWYISPMLSLEYSPTLLSLFRASIGYSISITDDWRINGNPDSKVGNMPATVNSNGLTAQFAILFGIFNY